MVKNPTANAEDTGSILGPGRSDMPWGTKPKHPRACAPQQEKPPQQEVLELQLENSPHLPQIEKAYVQQ